MSISSASLFGRLLDQLALLAGLELVGLDRHVLVAVTAGAGPTARAG